MINGILESSRGCLKEEIRMDVISNNLANSSVIGFKKDRISFKQVLDQVNPAAGETDSTIKTNDRLLVTVIPDMSQGDIRATGNSLDLAIFGNGFFKVNTPDGIRYSRKGNFDMDPQGNLVTQAGYLVIGKNGPLNLRGDAISIDNRGVISSEGLVIGELDIVDFDDYDKLEKTGFGFFNNITGEPENELPLDTRVKQGYLEISNVNIAEEMVNMIHSLRAFESYQKSIKIIDEIDSRAINQVGRLR